jgi:hypothetical protein
MAVLSNTVVGKYSRRPCALVLVVYGGFFRDWANARNSPDIRLNRTNLASLARSTLAAASYQSVRLCDALITFGTLSYVRMETMERSCPVYRKCKVCRCE